jgi:hypothetical protein
LRRKFFFLPSADCQISSSTWADVLMSKYKLQDGKMSKDYRKCWPFDPILTGASCTLQVLGDSQEG